MEIRQVARRSVAFFLIILVLTSLGTWAAYVQFDRPVPGFDDAYIYFVYGENITNGEGIVYNSGGEKVEGFTSALWMLIVTIVFVLFEQHEFWLLLLNLILISVAIASLWWFVIGGELVHWHSALFLAWIFCSPSFVVWMTLPLMDVTLWSALLIWATIVTVKATSSRLLAVLVALVVLARPEGIVWGCVFVGLFGLGIVARSGIASLWQNIRLPLFAFLITLGALIGARLVYFGYPLPNTYYAKVSPDALYNLAEGGYYLVEFAASNAPAMILVFGASVAGIVFNLPKILRGLSKAPTRIDENVNTQYLVVSLIAVVGLLVPVLIGGDHFSMFRFYQPIWPLLILPILAMLDVAHLPIPRPLRYGVVLGALLLLSLAPWITWRNLPQSWIRTEFSTANGGEALGNTLNSMFVRDPPSVGYQAAGNFAFVYTGEVVDLFGLNNVAMAHAPGNRYGVKNHAAFNIEVFLNQQPDLLEPKILSCDRLSEIDRSIPVKQVAPWRQLFADKRFHELYVATILSDSERCIQVWVNRNVVEKLANEGYGVEVIEYHTESTG